MARYEDFAIQMCQTGNAVAGFDLLHEKAGVEAMEAITNWVSKYI